MKPGARLSKAERESWLAGFAACRRWLAGRVERAFRLDVRDVAALELSGEANPTLPPSHWPKENAK